MPRNEAHVKQRKVKRKLEIQLISVFLIVSLIPCLLIGYVSIRAVTNSTQVTLGKYSQKIMDQLANSINKELMSVEGIVESLNNDMTFLKLVMNTDELTTRQRLTYEANADKQISDFVKSQSSVEEIYVLYNNEKKYRSKLIKEEVAVEAFLSSSLYDQMKNQDYKSYGWYPSEFSKGQFYVAKKMTDEMDSPILIALLNAHGFQNAIELASIEEGIAIEILDTNHHVLVDNTEGEVLVALSKAEYALDKIINTQLQTDTFIMENTLISYAKLTNGWQIILSAPLSLLMQDLQEAWMMMGIILVVCIIMGLGMSIFMGRRITGPIVMMSRLMREVEEGNLDIEINMEEVKTYSFEVDLLAKGFGHMLQHLKRIIENAKEVTNGVKQNTMQLEKVATHTASSARDVEQAIEGLAIGAQEQRNEIEATLENVQFLADYINEVTYQIKEIEKVSKQSMARSIESKSGVELLWSQTQGTLVMNQNIQEQVNRLGEKANNISNITKQINMINRQTNLLALNASIEATNAGQYGLGFVAVAQEVKNLSTQIQSATLCISEAVKEIQEERQATLKELNKAMNVFNKQVPVVEATQHSFETINEQMLQVDQKIGHLTELLMGVENQKTEVVERMKKISSVVEQSVSISEEVSSTSEEQSSHAKEIKDMVVDLVENVDKLEVAYKRFI